MRASEFYFQFDLIPERDIVIPDQWDAWFSLPRFMDCPAVDGNKLKPASLVKAKCLQIVIGRDQEETLSASDTGFLGNLFEEFGANPVSLT